MEIEPVIQWGGEYFGILSCTEAELESLIKAWVNTIGDRGRMLDKMHTRIAEVRAKREADEQEKKADEHSNRG